MIAPILASIGMMFLCASPTAIDGDTIRCADGVHVRIWGIQAPERYMPDGPASTRAMSNLLRGHHTACIVMGPNSYDRVVAKCFIQSTDTDVAGEMVRQGFAVDWYRYSHGAYAR